MADEFKKLLALARSGNSEALGTLLAKHQRLLKLLAKVEVGRHIQGKVDESDIVQETFLQAHRSFETFEGEVEPQFAGWLRGILAHSIAGAMRRFLGTKARDPRLEQQIANDLDRSAMSLGGFFVDPGSSPSQHVMRHEQNQVVLDALSRLPEDYEQVLILRHLEGLTFPEIAPRMGRTVNAVEKLWVRALAKLKKEFSESTLQSEG